jgi:outer membrane protein W
VDYVNGKSDSKNAFTPTLGASVNYDLNQHWVVNVAVDRLPAKFSDTEKANIDVFFAGLAYRF